MSRASCMCQKGAHVASPNDTCPQMLTISPSSLSRIRPLEWAAALAKYFLQGFARLQVARAALNQSFRKWHYRLSSFPARRTISRPPRSDEPFGPQRRKCLNITLATIFCRLFLKSNGDTPAKCEVSGKNKSCKVSIKLISI